MSIRVKLLMILFGSVLFFVIFTTLCNSVLLEPYYSDKKEQVLTESFETVKELDFSATDIVMQLKMIEEKQNVQILIIDHTRSVFFCSSSFQESLFLPVVGEEGVESGERWFSEWLVPDAVGHDSVEIFSTQPNYGTRYNSSLSVSYLSLYAKANIDYYGRSFPFYIIINTSVAAIEESVKIANSFAMIVGAFTLAIASVAMFIISKRFVRPIEQVNYTAKKMAQLDFGKRLQIDSRDEVSELADSINHLSEQLELKISELSIANQQLRQELLHKERIDTMRREFISDVSHELKTPLAIIMGYCEGLQLNINNDEREYYCSVIEDEAIKMNKLAARLLKLAELESGEIVPEMGEFDLTKLVRERVETLSYLLEERNVVSEFIGEDPLLVCGDAERIEEVINNLLTNARNHTPDNGFIRVSVFERNDNVVCEVFNSGSHIPEESIDKIWESFYKVDKARTRAYGGSGLGLKIVSTILKSHDADFGVENTELGVLFYFALRKSDRSAEQQ